MPKRVAHSKISKPHFIRQWRKYRQLTQEQLAARLDMSTANLSRVEAGKQPYTQPLLEAIADALGTDPASLIMRDPTRGDAIWRVWDQATLGQRIQILEVAKALLKTAS